MTANNPRTNETTFNKPDMAASSHEDVMKPKIIENTKIQTKIVIIILLRPINSFILILITNAPNFSLEGIPLG